MSYDMNRDRAIRTAKAEALREAAAALSEEDGGQDNTWWYTDWLTRRADEIEQAPFPDAPAVGLIMEIGPNAVVPEGWLLLEGQPFEPNRYPALAQVVGTMERLPDLRPARYIIYAGKP